MSQACRERAGRAGRATSAGAARVSPLGAAFVALAAVLVVVAVSLALFTAGRSVIPLPALAPDCTVSAPGGGEQARLTTSEAERAALLAAADVRRGRPLATTTATLRRELDLDARDAGLAASALTGRARASLACRHGGSGEQESDRLDRRGLTARAETVRSDVDRAFGPQRLGGFARGGISSGHQPGSAHYQGRAIDIFFRPATRAQRVRGWATAQYLVARAEKLAVDTVIYDDMIWTARRADEGWRDYQVDTSGRSRRVAAVLEHRDHVHVDVAD